jgi:hypothetical protein
MATALTVNIPAIQYAKGVLSEAIMPGVLQFNVAGKHFVHDEISLTTSYAAVNKGNIGTLGFYYFKNTDATNNVLISTDGGSTAAILLAPGQVALGFASSTTTTFQAKGSASTPSMEYFLLEA